MVSCDFFAARIYRFVFLFCFCLVSHGKSDLLDVSLMQDVFFCTSMCSLGTTNYCAMIKMLLGFLLKILTGRNFRKSGSEAICQSGCKAKLKRDVEDYVDD